ncbi:hypothetical protein QJS66_07825 [Kocuria rhizophila]|nr:hypothetical protein QJS66_07825 [Kocuria rhizophila]
MVAGLGQMEPWRCAPGQDCDFARLRGGAGRCRLLARGHGHPARGVAGVGGHDVFRPPRTTPLQAGLGTSWTMRWFAGGGPRTLTAAEHPSVVVAPPCRGCRRHRAVPAASFKDQLPGGREMLERIAVGRTWRAWSPLAPLLADEMVQVLSLLPGGSISRGAQPEKVRARAHDLVAADEEFLMAAWDSASGGGDAPGPQRGAGRGRRRRPHPLLRLVRTIAEVRELALERSVGWSAVTGLNVNAVTTCGRRGHLRRGGPPRGHGRGHPHRDRARARPGYWGTCRPCCPSWGSGQARGLAHRAGHGRARPPAAAERAAAPERTSPPPATTASTRPRSPASWS